ncbi:hypothetical protein BU17DRAFT_70255 [Hysterangium stoloniferum]|nr:hypothetical protein BU17DRAFT_70255 [Hysterangium stoloniferum]
MAPMQNDVSKAEKISVEHNKTMQWTKSQLLLGGKMLGQKCNASAWNAFTRKEMEAINKNLLGQHYTLPIYIQQHYQDIKVRYNSLSDEDHAALVEELCDVRHLVTSIGKQFCKDVLNMDHMVLLHKFEAYPLAWLKSYQCILFGPVKMNYDQYETQVVWQWGKLSGVENTICYASSPNNTAPSNTPNAASSSNNTAPSDTPNTASSHSDTPSSNPPNTVSSASNNKSSTNYVMSIK